MLQTIIRKFSIACIHTEILNMKGERWNSSSYAEISEWLLTQILSVSGEFVHISALEEKVHDQCRSKPTLPNPKNVYKDPRNGD